ncbi:glycosyltransferase family 32 protein [Acetobacter fallax]|uniref:hypothetical protein n=1 Tax=Acetobacter fallax TaxID=1737473 RepID=UPI0030CB7FE6
MYRIAYDLHSSQPGQTPGAHVLLELSLLCGLKAGQTPAPEEMETLRSLSLPFYNYIVGIQTAWTQGDFVKAARIMGNCYEEFHTGAECDRLYLEIVNRIYHEQMQGGIADIRAPNSLIPRKLYTYRDVDAPDGAEHDFAWHSDFTGLEFRSFNKEEAANWLYTAYGVDARTLFLSAQNVSEASDFFRMHVMQQLGGWWLDAGNRIRSEDVFFSRVSQRHSHVFLLGHENVVHNGFFGTLPNSPILGDALLSLYRNCYQHPGLSIPAKTGSGVFERALNRTFHADLERLRPLPSMIIYDNAVFSDVIVPLSAQE